MFSRSSSYRPAVMSAVLTGSSEQCEISQCGHLPAGRCRLLQPICQHLHPRAVHLALALSFCLISVYLVFLYLSAPSCFFPPFTHNHTPSLHLVSLNLSLSHHRFMSSFFFQRYYTAGPPFSVPLSSQPFRADL